MNNTSSTLKVKSPAPQQATKIAIAKGDGIGPEIMESTLAILEAAGANIEPDYISIGEQEYLQGNTSGIAPSSWETINEHLVILKAPITTPQGKGYKSLNVTLRKSLGLFANVRPVRALDPFVYSGHPALDVVVIRENEEDLYAGIEHQQTSDVVQCLKLITRPGCEKIVRYAFEYAKAYGRKKVTCMVKDNIMKLTDGLFHRVFDEISAEYPEIENETMIIDIGSARLAARPEQFDVIVTSNLYGDIISDIVAEIAGSVGLCGSANIGSKVAMFEAIHGSAPDIAGTQSANPSGLINAAIMMLAHLGQTETADKIKNAWLATIEAGIHTADVFREGWSTKKVSTQEFTAAVIERLGESPKSLTASALDSGAGTISMVPYNRPVLQKQLVGVDVFIDWQGSDPEVIGERLTNLSKDGLKLKMITNRGVKVFPHGLEHTYCTDHWRCRFVSNDADIKTSPPSYAPTTYEEVLDLLANLQKNGHDVIKTENLYEFNGKRGFSLGQGE